MSDYDDWDGLRLCSVCNDRETRDDVCWSCREQEQIDRDVPAAPNREFFGQYHDYSACEPGKHVYSDNCYCDFCGEKQQDCG